MTKTRLSEHVCLQQKRIKSTPGSASVEPTVFFDGAIAGQTHLAIWSASWNVFASTNSASLKTASRCLENVHASKLNHSLAFLFACRLVAQFDGLGYRDFAFDFTRARSRFYARRPTEKQTHRKYSSSHLRSFLRVTNIRRTRVMYL